MMSKLFTIIQYSASITYRIFSRIERMYIERLYIPRAAAAWCGHTVHTPDLAPRQDTLAIPCIPCTPAAADFHTVHTVHSQWILRGVRDFLFEKYRTI